MNVTAAYEPVTYTIVAANAGYPGVRKYSYASPGKAKCPAASNESLNAKYSDESPPVNAERLSSAEEFGTSACVLISQPAR
jgi:hypothetical protein